MAQEITLTCYSLPAAPGLDNIKFEKGRKHDRQALGFILPANTQLQIRQPNNDAGITALEAYYTRVIDANNDWTGLNDSPASPLN